MNGGGRSVGYYGFSIYLGFNVRVFFEGIEGVGKVEVGSLC